jgi:SAM-dependent methyltransferase
MHDRLIVSQREYYDERADDFLDSSRPDRKVLGFIPRELAVQIVDELRFEGDVLELACGSGSWTRKLVRYADTLTALDGSPRMLERNAREVNDPKVGYIEADIFAWEPDRTYDNIFFGFWLSHVPSERFDDFWRRVGKALKPGGRVGFVDEDERASSHDDIRDVGGTPVATRRLTDGRTFDIVKIFWRPDALESKVRAIGWDVTVRPIGETFLYGAGTLRTQRDN